MRTKNATTLLLLAIGLLSVALTATAATSANSLIRTEGEIYVSNNRIADGLEYLATLARYNTTANRRTMGRSRSAVAMSPRQSTSTLTAQICSPVCDKVAAGVTSVLLKAMLPCTSVCEIIDVGLQSVVGLIVHFAVGPPPTPPPSG